MCLNIMVGIKSVVNAHCGKVEIPVCGRQVKQPTIFQPKNKLVVESPLFSKFLDFGQNTRNSGTRNSRSRL